jgi:integrase
MASIIDDPNGRKRIQFVACDGSRKTIRLGKCNDRAAESVRLRVEELASATINGHALSRETSMWLTGIGDKLHARLARVELVQSRAGAGGTRLGAFTDAYIAGRVDTKPRTIINLKQARKAMVEYFGADKPMTKITPGDADAFRVSLVGKGLAENTIRRICGRARQFFRAAIRRDLLHRNPFDGMKCSVGANPERLYFVSREEAERILKACPDAEWRLIFALSRYGGLRCPSEHLTLRWGDVDWEHDRMTVRSPKTEHHEGKATRLVPIFPELYPHLRAAYEAAEPGTEYVVTRCRDGSVNLRTQMERIICRAGLEPWPKPFHNLRATRETELAESFPLHVVCAWIGNSQPIAAKHYLQVTDQHFDRAIGKAGDQAGSADGQAGENAAQKAAHFPAQHAHADHRRRSHVRSESMKNPAKSGVFRSGAGSRENPNVSHIPPRGVEPLFSD